MSQAPRVLFLSENLQLGGLVLVSLARLARAGAIELVAAWTNSEAPPQPSFAAASHVSLLNAVSVELPIEGEAVLLGGAFVADYPTLARELNVDHQHVPSLAAAHVAAAAGLMRIDAAVVCGHSQRVPASLRSASRLGFLNLHPSLLPKHRGPFPGFWELRHGETESGVTLHVMEDRFDTGPMLAQSRIPLPFGVTFRELVRRQGEAGASLIEEALPLYLAGQLPPEQQHGGSSEPMPRAEDFLLDGSMTCDAVARFVAGMKGTAPVLLALQGLPFEVEAVVGAVENKQIQGAGAARMLHGGKAEFRAADGTVTLLVRPFSLTAAAQAEQQ